MIKEKKMSKSFRKVRLYEIMIYSWEDKNTTMIYDWHREILSPAYPTV
jgi:hypothetical protein